MSKETLCFRVSEGEGLLTDLYKLSRIDRLHNIVPNSQGERLFTHPVVRVRSHHHSWYMLMFGPELTEHLYAVHDGHVHVHHHASDRSLLRLKGHQCQACPAIVSHKDGVTHGLKSVFQGIADRGVVIDDQNPSSHETGLPRRRWYRRFQGIG